MKMKDKKEKDPDLLKKYFLIAEVIIAISIVIFLIGRITFNDNGIVSYCNLKIQIKKKHSEIQNLVLKNQQLSKMIESLNDEKGFAIEKIAREKLMLIKPDEIVYLLKSED